MYVELAQRAPILGKFLDLDNFGLILGQFRANLGPIMG